MLSGVTLYTILGPWLYWPLVVVAISGAVTWTLNCITVTYTEVWGQVKELKRLAGSKSPDN